VNRGLKRGDKRACQGVNRAGEPCSSTAVGDDGFCPLHRPGADPRAMGARGGRARGRTAELEQLTDREQAMAALRRALDGNNMAAMVAGAKALIEFDTSDPRSRDAVSTEDARERLMAKVEAMAERQADALAHRGLCPFCERAVSRAEAEALMARGADESQAGWLARIAWKPVPGGGAKT
jgi:hypothetical protein